jgi:hypothetical protein
MVRPTNGSRRRPVRSGRATKQKWIAAAQICGVVLFVGVIASAAYYAMSAKQHLDAETLCPAKPQSFTVLLVDVTDPMNTAQRQDFLNQLERLKNSIPRYGKLSVIKVDAAAAHLLRPLITRCNPGTAADENEQTGNPARLQKKWDEQFSKPLDAAFEQIGHASGADNSPILESVQSVALTEFAQQGAEGKPHQLILASDLLQNTGGINFYKGLPDSDAFVESAPFNRVRTDLRGADVELWMLQRDDTHETQPRALPDLWDRIITEQGGNLKRLYRVSG